MSTSQTNPEKGLTKSGPFSPDRYNGGNALEVGLPSPEAMNLLVLFSQQMVGTPFVPKALGNGPNPAGNILAVILTGREEGFTPMEALRSYWMSPDGRLAKYADALMAKMRRAGFKFPIKEFSDTKAFLKGIRPDGEDYESSFTIEEAKRAGLSGKAIWQQYPQRMLKARVIGDVYRFLASDLGGPTYTAEELQDVHGEAEATDLGADQRRMDVLQAQEDKYKVTLKAQPAEPVTVDVKPAADPVPVKQAPPVEPQEDPLVYEVHVVATTGGGKPKALRCEHIEPQKSPVTAGLMAQSAASDTGMDHIVLERNTKTGEVNQIGGRYKGAVKVPAPKDDPKPTPAPAAQEQPKPEPAAEPPAASTDGSAKQPPTTLERLNALAAFMGMAPKTAMARFNAFMVGFVGMPAKDLKEAKDPATTALKSKALEALECTIHHDADAFNAGPEASGARHRNWLDGVDTYLTSLWPKPEEAATKALAIKLFQQWDNSPGQFKAWVEMDGIDLAFQPMPDVHATLRGFLRTREMSKVLTMARAHNLSVAAIVQQIEERGLKCSLEEATEARIEQAIEGFRLALRDAAKSVDTPAPKAPEPEAPPAAAKADEPEEPAGEDQDSLFSNADW